MKSPFEKMSWVGKVADNPKPFGVNVQGNEPVSINQLSQVEENILKTLDELFERFSAKSANEDKDNDK